MSPLNFQSFDDPELQGWRLLALDGVGSTNDEAMALAKAGDHGRVWVTASHQQAGKARRGRVWESKTGNLYASLLLIDPADSAQVATLPLVVSLALHKAVSEVAPESGDNLKIKWPNDLLLNNKKLSGILLEAVRDPYGRLAVVIGCGVNCLHYPENPLYPATSLAEAGSPVEPLKLFHHLAKMLAVELRIWAGGAGFSIIRREWLDRAAGLGDTITARFPDHEVTGRFVDLDKDGLLLLCDAQGKSQRISAADIFFGISPIKGA